ncbi:MAG: response regulator transcription factor [Anaerolineales bacterium]|nr:response regulator transcription factor [Anaerolineales bacterium]
MNVIRLLIADDHTLFREGLRALLSVAPDVALVGEAATGEEAVALAATLEPDVVLMDIQMPGLNGGPGLNGLDATRRITHTSPHIGVVMLTMHADDDSVFAAMRAGARGYVLKGADKEEVLRAIRAAARGEALFGPAVARRLMHFFGALAASARSAPPLAFPELTERERDVLGLIAQGLNNAAIAERLSLSPKTVGNHISNIFSKLQVADRAQAIIRAREAGLVTPRPGPARPPASPDDTPT